MANPQSPECGGQGGTLKASSGVLTAQPQVKQTALDFTNGQRWESNFN